MAGVRRLDDRPRVEPHSRAAWRAWLEANHGTSGAVWLVTRKKSAGDVPLTQAEAIEEALCFGWIDSLPRRLDDTRTMLLMAPRKPGSAWSRINKDRVARLLAEGLLAPPGVAKIEAAKADGSWDKLQTVDALIAPEDLQRAFAGRPGSAEHWAAFPVSARRGILEWIGAAKGADTRARRVEETARLAADNIRANQWRR